MGSEGGVFKWSDANTADLIVWRVSNSSLFTGRRNAAIKAFELYVKEKQLEGKVSPAWVRKKWENLKQKYKDLKSLNMVGGDTAIATWKWYAIMDGALSAEIPLDRFIEPDHVTSFAPPIKQRKEEDWLIALREMERRQAAEREDERDRRAAAREEERDRRAAEREEMRERRALEREERREREMFAREERWEKEMLAREERQEREYREREERREREAAAREERLFKVLETFLANK